MDAQNSAPNNITPSNGQMPIGMSASQMGLNQPKNKLINVNIKTLLIKLLIALVTLGALLTILIATNIFSISKFKSVDYTNLNGTHYKLDFYSKYTTNKLKSGNNQLVSKVSEGGKLPLSLSISTGQSASYRKLKDCASYTKVLDVQNDNLKQKISVCNIDMPNRRSITDIIYVAGFKFNDQVHVVTMSQDYSTVDLSSQSGAQKSINKFGLNVYKNDVTKIISSIKVED